MFCVYVCSSKYCIYLTMKGHPIWARVGNEWEERRPLSSDTCCLLLSSSFFKIFQSLFLGNPHLFVLSPVCLSSIHASHICHKHDTTNTITCVMKVQQAVHLGRSLQILLCPVSSIWSPVSTFEKSAGSFMSLENFYEKYCANNLSIVPYVCHVCKQFVFHSTLKLISAIYWLVFCIMICILVPAVYKTCALVFYVLSRCIKIIDCGV